MRDIELAPSDFRAQERLKGFIPDRVFDVHAHVYDRAFIPNMAKPGTIEYDNIPVAGADEMLSQQGKLYGDVFLRANLIIFPDPAMADLSNGMREAGTQFLKKQLEKHPECVGEAFVIPSDTKEDVEKLLIHPNIRGFKCYHVTANRQGKTFDADIGEYLPESAWQVADERGLCITLHMVKKQALADPGNLDYIQKMARKYPNAKLILAHAARSFAAWTAMESVKKLKDYPNVLFDIAAVCESPSIFEVIRQAGPQRVMWGSDYPVSLMRGKCISIADSFLWLYKEQLELCASNTEFDADLVGMEGLLAFQQAAYMLNLSRAEVEDIFYHNAMRLFNLKD